ncbi:hypothetical protein F5B17DRAFT_416448 [Nemania serpens]|nr:hypothetical protein F5B17DRAFT_416448 [Nemania serpens]
MLEYLWTEQDKKIHQFEGALFLSWRICCCLNCCVPCSLSYDVFCFVFDDEERLERQQHEKFYLSSDKKRYQSPTLQKIGICFIGLIFLALGIMIHNILIVHNIR